MRSSSHASSRARAARARARGREAPRGGELPIIVHGAASSSGRARSRSASSRAPAPGRRRRPTRSSPRARRARARCACSAGRSSTRPCRTSPVQLRRDRLDEAHERLDAHAAVDVDDAGGGVARGVDRRDRRADRVPDQHRRLETGGERRPRAPRRQRARGRGGRAQGCRRARAGRTRSRGGRGQRVEDRIPHAAVERQPVQEHERRPAERRRRAGGRRARPSARERPPSRLDGNSLIGGCHATRVRAPRRPSPRWPTVGFTRGSRPAQLAARRDLELAVGGAQVHLDRAHRDEQRLRDLGVREAVGGERGDAALARRERVDAAARHAARPGAGGAQLGARELDERGRAACGASSIPRAAARASGALARAAQRGAELDERVCELERRAARAQMLDRRSRCARSRPPALGEAEHAQRRPDPPRDPKRLASARSSSASRRAASRSPVAELRDRRERAPGRAARRSASPPVAPAPRRARAGERVAHGGGARSASCARTQASALRPSPYGRRRRGEQRRLPRRARRARSAPRRPPRPRPASGAPNRCRTSIASAARAVVLGLGDVAREQVDERAPGESDALAHQRSAGARARERTPRSRSAPRPVARQCQRHASDVQRPSRSARPPPGRRARAARARGALGRAVAQRPPARARRPRSGVRRCPHRDGVRGRAARRISGPAGAPSKSSATTSCAAGNSARVGIGDLGERRGEERASLGRPAAREQRIDARLRRSRRARPGSRASPSACLQHGRTPSDRLAARARCRARAQLAAYPAPGRLLERAPQIGRARLGRAACREPSAPRSRSVAQRPRLPHRRRPGGGGGRRPRRRRCASARSSAARACSAARNGAGSVEVHGRAQERMLERQRLAVREHAGCDQRRHARERRRVVDARELGGQPEIAAVTEHGHGASQFCGRRVEPRQPRQDRGAEPIAGELAEQAGVRVLGRETRRAHAGEQLAEQERIASRRVVTGTGERGRRLQLQASGDDLGGGGETERRGRSTVALALAASDCTRPWSPGSGGRQDAISATASPSIRGAR